MLAVSTLGNAEYGNYLDADTANNLFDPAPEASIAVQAWLHNQGISKISSDGHRLTFEITVKSANKLLSTSFRIYQNTDSGISNVRTTQYSVPNGLAKFIDFITPTTYFGVPKSIQKPTPSLHASPKRDGAVSSDQIYKFCSIDDPYGTIISPNFQKELYNVGNYTPEVDMGSRAGFVTMDDLFTIYDDLFKFEELLNITKQTITTIPIDEASNNKHRVVITMRETSMPISSLEWPIPSQSWSSA